MDVKFTALKTVVDISIGQTVRGICKAIIISQLVKVVTLLECSRSQMTANVIIKNRWDLEALTYPTDKT